MAGNPTEILEFCDADLSNNYVHLTWENDLLIQKQYKDRSMFNEYYLTTNRLIKKFISFDGSVYTYEYDENLRLKKSKSRGENIVRQNVYSFAGSVGGLNTISNMQYFSGGSGESVQINFTSNSNGLGLTKSNILEDFTDEGSDLGTSSSYDIFGRVLSNSNPFNAQGESTYSYENSPIGKMVSNTPASGDVALNYSYSINSSTLTSPLLGTLAANSYLVTQHNDEKNSTITVWKDIFGRTVFSKIEGGDNLPISGPVNTWYEYDDRNQLRKLQNHIGQLYTFSYNSDGMIAGKTLPGNVSFGYEYDSKNRQWAVSYPGGRDEGTYNDFGQILTLTKVGEGTISYTYFNSGIKKGKLETKVVPIIGGGTIHYIYDYDSYGRNISSIETGINGSTIKLLTVYANHRDLIGTTSQEIKLGNNTTNINYGYTYDETGRLKITKFGMTYNSLSLGEFTLSKISYNSNNWIISKEIGDGIQTNLYGYTPRGWLKNINGVGGGDAQLAPSCHTPGINYPCIKKIDVGVGPTVGIGHNKNELNC